MRLWDRAVVLLAQVLEDEKVMEAMAKRSIPEFRAGDSLEVKLVPPSGPDNRYSRASALVLRNMCTVVVIMALTAAASQHSDDIFGCRPFPRTSGALPLRRACASPVETVACERPSPSATIWAQQEASSAPFHCASPLLHPMLTQLSHSLSACAFAKASAEVVIGSVADSRHTSRRLPS